MALVDDILAWPPPYTIRKHPRAKNIKLVVSVEKGVELVVPKRFNQKDVIALFEENKTWLQKQLLKIQEESKHVQRDTLPDEILFKAIQQHWRIEYIPVDKKLKIISRPHQELVLIGDIGNYKICRTALIKWMKNQARLHLAEQLRLCSQEIKLPFKNVVIRDQASRWGSCSSTKMINLNYKLLFLPYELMRHVMIHELCHTVHLDHSENFWNTVERFDPNWKAHRRELKNGSSHIPGWLR